MTPSSLLGNRSFFCLTCAQFLGAANDNLFKMVVSLFAVQSLTEINGSSYLSLTGALFAIPYLVFSGYAGHLADVVSKRTVLTVSKFAEIVIMAGGLIALAHADRIEGLLVVLFLMATHSTFFSPAKYGSVPEIVSTRQLARANGVLEATRYTAIILGTAAGGVLMQMWPGTPIRIGVVVVAIAIAGFFCTICIAPLAPSTPPRSWPKHPWTSLGEGLARLTETRSLAIAVASLTFFDAIATLVLLDVLLIAKFELNLGDAAAGTVGAFAALGTGLGALLCGYLSGAKVELGITPIAGLGIAAALLALGAPSHSYALLGALLFILGVFAGLFVVPFVAWLQKAARHDEKGLIISTANFVDMAGVLGASGVLWFLHDALGLGPRAILAVSGVATVLYVLALFVMWKRLQSHVALFLRSFQFQPRVP